MVYTNRCEAGQRGVRVATEAGITICGSICVNLMTNPANCGACARACASDRMCVAGACVPVQRSCESSTTPGCGMVRFMGGAFTQGDSMAVAATPVMTTTVSPFAIDAYEVTVARFRQFWAARPTTAAPTTLRARGIAYRGGTIAWGEAAQDRFIDGTSCNWSATDDRASAHPMNCVDYWLAQEFCVWDGGRLPTEAEWEFAARGSAVGGLTPGRVYPWGAAEPVGSSAVSCQRAHFNSCRGDDSRLTVPVGRFPATAELFDMAGNVSEWTADTYSQYTMCGISPAAADPLCNASARVEPRRVHRGGSYSTAAIYLRAASREARQDSTGSVGIGFRCARDVSL
jgi:formylglycine-generating enzyme required for sulfatase activity